MISWYTFQLEWWYTFELLFIAQFSTQHPNLTLDGINLTSHSDYANGFYRKITPLDKSIIEKNINPNILIYFPHSRYDHPEWLHSDAKIGFKVNKKYLGHTDDSIIKDHVIPEVITWLLIVLPLFRPLDQPFTYMKAF